MTQSNAADTPTQQKPKKKKNAELSDPARLTCRGSIPFPAVVSTPALPSRGSIRSNPACAALPKVHLVNLLASRASQQSVILLFV